MNPIIRIENLGKKYRTGTRGASYTTLRESLTKKMRAPLDFVRRNGSSPLRSHMWALKDINLEIMPGEVIGIIGRNGAGKSTLLKILSRITEPTTGRVELYGRVGSLLEVGTGFHPELTGRENVYLNGAILGMKKAEIDRKFDEIVAFAEVEEFLNTPVKHYSSGMYVRLAFAVAVHLEPEILIIDEVLAVGDISFQQKCLEKMRGVTNRGWTVLLVSHNMVTVGQLCAKSIWLDQGQIKASGPSAEVIAEYLTANRGLTGEYLCDETEGAASSQIFITAARIRNAQEQMVAAVDAQQPFFIEIEYEVMTPGLAWLGFTLSTSSGVDVLAATDGDVDVLATTPRARGRHLSRCMIPANLFNAGRFALSFYVAKTVASGVEILEYLENVLIFDIENPAGIGRYMPKVRTGVISPQLSWEQTAQS